MIERITTEYPDFDDLKYTVNQLVDAVNGILDYAPLEMAMKAEKPNIDIAELAYLQKENGDLKDELERTRKALDYCIERFKSLENVLDEKAEASDIPDNPDLYAWAVRIKPIWGELKEITGIDYTTEHK